MSSFDESTAAEQAHQAKLLSHELARLRDDVSDQLAQAENLTTMFRRLVQRIDLLDKRHQETVKENAQLRLELREKDDLIEKLQARLRKIDGLTPDGSQDG